MADSASSIVRKQEEGHRALLELESQFNTKPQTAVLSIQGSQIHALTRFARIFEIYPYPIVINIAVLKLADWFRTSNNVVKIYVYKVFKEASDLHLAKVINVEETVRRILPVLGSNDPIARSITLRVLGCMSMIIAEKLDVHHGIIQRMELATDRIEVEAAIWAADQICARSIRFPSVIFSKIVTKIQHCDTSFDIKLRLVKMFRHMHKDLAMARQAKQNCLDLLSQPQLDKKLVIVVLRTLTLLLGEALIDRKDQIDRLLDYALHDTREEVQYSLLYDLVLLGKNDVMFDETHIIRLVRTVISMSATVRLQQRAYRCARTLIQSHRQLVMHILWQDSRSITCKDFMQSISNCKQSLHGFLEKYQITLAIPCAQFLCTILEIALNSDRTADRMDMDEPGLTAHEMLTLGKDIMEWIDQLDISFFIENTNQKTAIPQLRDLLKVKTRLCLLLDNVDVDGIFRNAYDAMINLEHEEHASILRNFLTSISVKCQNLPNWFTAIAANDMSRLITNNGVFVHLVRLYICVTRESQSESDSIYTLIEQFGGWDASSELFTRNAWDLYVIGGDAGVHGWYHLMHRIMRVLSKKVESDACRYWLSFLSSLAQAERTRESNSDHYLDALIQLRSFQALATPRIFQTWYLQLRMEMVKALQHLVAVLDTVIPESSPTLRDSRKLESLMNTCAVRFRRLAFRYDFTAQSFFGMSNNDMAIIESYKICALACEHAARTFAKTDGSFYCIDPSLIPLLHSTNDTSKNSLEATRDGCFQTLCSQFIQKVADWEKNEHVQDIDRKVQRAKDIQMFSNTFLKQPLVLPRSFLHNQKNVATQLTLEPMLDEKTPIELGHDEDLVIKFEGLVQMPPQSLQRKVCKAAIVCFATRHKIVHLDDRLGVSMIFSDPIQALGDVGKESIALQPPTIFIANVNNSYFSYTGLLRFPRHDATPGGRPLKQAWVNIFVKLIDDHSKIWATGPTQYGLVSWK